MSKRTPKRTPKRPPTITTSPASALTSRQLYGNGELGPNVLPSRPGQRKATPRSRRLVADKHVKVTGAPVRPYMED